MLGQAAALGYRQHTYCYREAQSTKEDATVGGVTGRERSMRCEVSFLQASLRTHRL